jgi:proline racemase
LFFLQPTRHKERFLLKFDPARNSIFERHAQRIRTIDSHTAGEPTRLIVDGLPPVQGKTMDDKRRWFQRHLDDIRLQLTREPRGHRDILAAALTEPVHPGSSFGLIYMDAQRYPFLCGHATIGAVATAIEAGWIEAGSPRTEVVIDTPSGPMAARAHLAGGRAQAVTIEMVPSFVHETDRPLTVPGFGQLKVETVCVGGFFVMVAADQLGIALDARHSRRLTELGMAVIEAANDQLVVRHPLRPEVTTIDVVKFYDTSAHDRRTGKGVVIYGEGHMDRSPCGTGTAATLTLLHHQGRLGIGQPFTSLSPLDTRFRAEITAEKPVGAVAGVTVAITGSAHLTGIHEFISDPSDPLPRGFLL